MAGQPSAAAPAPIANPNRSIQWARSAGAYDPINNDRAIATSGDMGRIGGHVQSVFENRDIEGASPEMMQRLADQIAAGDLRFGDVRYKADNMIGSSDLTLGYAGKPAPVSLPPEALAQLLAQRRGATSQYEGAQADAMQARGRLEAEHLMGVDEVQHQMGQHRRGLMDSMGDRGMAFQPAGAGRGQRRAADMEGRQLGRMEQQLGMGQAEIAQMVSRARRERDAQLGDVEAQEARMRSELVRDAIANFDRI